MTNIELYIFLFVIPGVLGNVSHMLVVKKNVFPFLAIPLSSRFFGRNKTWRGFLYLPLCMGFICLVESLISGPFSGDMKQDILIGLGLGLAYMISELPNSFVKRRMGIASGESVKRFRTLQLIIDKTDSLLGACILFALILNLPVKEIVVLFFVCLILHISISSLLYILKLKKSI